MDSSYHDALPFSQGFVIALFVLSCGAFHSAIEVNWVDGRIVGIFTEKTKHIVRKHLSPTPTR